MTSLPRNLRFLFVLACSHAALGACASESDGVPSPDAGSAKDGSGSVPDAAANKGPVQLGRIPLFSDGLAVAGNSVFTYDKNGSGEVGAIVRVPKDGSAPVPSYYSPKGSLFFPRVHLAGSGDDLYFVETTKVGDARSVRLLKKNVTTGTEIELASAAFDKNKVGWSIVAFDETSVFLQQGSDVVSQSVYRVAKAGGKPELVFSADPTDIRDLQLEGSDFWFSDTAGNAYRVPKTDRGTRASPVANGLFCTYGSFATAEGRYCAGGDGKFLKMALDLTGKRVLYDSEQPLVAEARGFEARAGLLTSNAVYLPLDISSVVKGPLLKIDRATEAVTIVTGERPDIKLMEADEASIFWLEDDDSGPEQDTRIFKMAR